MKPKDRDELLIRLDERTNNIWRVLDEQEDSINDKIDTVNTHLVTLNGNILNHAIKISVNRRWLGAITTGLTLAVLRVIGIY